MIRRIELVNFMSHARTVIEPAPGLTVLTGPNNCGKSAVVAALQILAHNENSTYVIRHDEKEAAVIVETDDGHAVEWRRKNSPRYLIDGQPFDRLRGELPPELHKALRLDKVKVENGEEFDIHFGEQKSPVFLLDKPGSHAAQFFASSSDAASLVEMQNRHKQKTQLARKERADLDLKSAKLKDQLMILDGVDAITPDVESIEQQFRTLQAEEKKIVALQQLLHQVNEFSMRIAQLDADCEALSELSIPPTMQETQSLERLTRELARESLAHVRESHRAETLTTLDVPPDLSAERALSTLVQDLSSADSKLNRLSSSCNAVLSLTAPPEMDSTDSLRQIISSIATATASLNRSQLYQDCLQNLTDIPEQSNTAELAQSLRELQRAQLSLDATEKSLRVESQALADAEHALRELAKEESVCPTCGAAIDADRLIALASAGKVHAHG